MPFYFKIIIIRHMFVNQNLKNMMLELQDMAVIFIISTERQQTFR